MDNSAKEDLYSNEKEEFLHDESLNYDLNSHDTAFTFSETNKNEFDIFQDNDTKIIGTESEEFAGKIKDQPAEVYDETKPYRETIIIPVQHIIRIEENDRENEIQ